MSGTASTSTKDGNAAGQASRRLIIAVVCVLCLGLLGSALYAFATLSRLRTLYLSNRGHEIATAIETRARGGGRRNNPVFWQSLFEESYSTYSNSAAFFALVDQSGSVLAGIGNLPPGPLENGASKDSDIYNFEEPLAPPRNPHSESNPGVAGWRIRIGLYSLDADFIRRQAFLQLAISGLAVITLLILSVYLMRMLNRFLELKAREGAEAQLKSIGMMAASLAHEIRNPLGAMKGLTQLAQEDLPPDDAVQARLHTVVREAERLERLVTDLLDFARPKEPQISEFDLTDLLSDVKIMLQPRLETSQVALQFPMNQEPLNIQSDPGGLRQVLLNTVINAVDASPAGGTVVLRIIQDAGNRVLTIQVDDAGPGLGKCDPEELFQPFVTTKARGTGLGLAISRQIVESLGGSLTLGNHARGGARCSVQLPLRGQKE
jgi:signal transduction histidine kinase